MRDISQTGRRRLSVWRSLVFTTAFVLAIAGAAFSQERLPAKVELAAKLSSLEIVSRAQGARDTCSLFALAALATFETAKVSPPTRQPLSEEFLTWAANEATGLSGDQAMFYEAVHGLNTFGVCTDKHMPYEGLTSKTRRPSAEALADAKERSQRWKVHWIRRWSLDAPLTNSELLAIKKALANQHLVACGLRWPRSLDGSSILEVLKPGDVRDGHSIVFLGYEDDPSKPGGGILRFRNSHGPKWGENGDGWMSYAYATAYANDALWMELGAPGAEKPMQRFEAETLPIRARQQCETSRQSMDKWGKGMWSQGTHLFCGARNGGMVELEIDVRKSARYRLRVLGTAAPDFGIIQVALDGKRLGPEFDLYAGRVCPAGSLELGDHELTAGDHSLRFTVTGKHASSKNYYFGLDAVDLLPPWDRK